MGKITEIEVVPVAGEDSMLLNLSGAHAPMFTRVVLILHSDDNQVGLGEVPCSQSILEMMRAMRDAVCGTCITDFKSTLLRLWQKYGIQDNSERGIQTYDLRTAVHAITAYEAALLDLNGKLHGLPVAKLLGCGQQRDSVPFLGYLFFVGDKSVTELEYRDYETSSDSWAGLRDQPTMDTDSVVRLAEAAQSTFGFNDFKLKGGVFAPEKEADCVLALKNRFPDARITLDPNGCWSLEEAVSVGNKLKDAVAYMEDPCGAEAGYSGREIMAEFRRKTGIKTATNMIATDRRQLGHALQLGAVDIPLADPHFWGMEGACRVASICADFGLTWGAHSNNHFDISLAMVTHVAAAAEGEITAIDTHWIWQEGQDLTRQPPVIKDGAISITDEPGLGVEIDRKALELAHARYLSLRVPGRDDSMAMQYLIKEWRFDPKRPCLVR